MTITPTAATATADQHHAIHRDTINALAGLARAHRASCHTPGCPGDDVDLLLAQRGPVELHGLLAVALVALADGTGAA